MSERVLPFSGKTLARKIAAAAMCLVTGWGVAGCGESGPAQPDAIGRCFDAPLPPLPKATASPSMEIKEGPDGLISGDEKSSPTAVEKIMKGAGVQISVDAKDEDPFYMSGFIAQNSKGAQVVVTAGHGPMHTDLKGLTIKDGMGNTSEVDRACFVHESSERGFMPLAHTGTPDKDVAVLMPRRRLGGGVLTLSQDPPKRGNWYGTLNWTETNGAQHRYNLLCLGQSPQRSDRSTYMLSGLEPWRPDGIDYSAPGASGGMVVTLPNNNEAPQIAGLIAGGIHGRPADRQKLSSDFTTTVVGETSAKLKVDYVTPTSVIQAALDVTNHW